MECLTNFGFKRQPLRPLLFTGVREPFGNLLQCTKKNTIGENGFESG